MKFIDVDEASELTIRCKANRSFEMAINLSRNLLGKAYKLQVIDNDTPILTFQQNEGLIVDGQSVVLAKSPASMDLPTGTYCYDLVEITADKAENIFFGWFVIQPSYSTL